MQSAACLLLIFFGLAVRAEYSTFIPCREDKYCLSALTAKSRAICVNGRCICPNATSKMYEDCLPRNLVRIARFGGESRDCTSDANCSSIEGAKCFRPSSDPSKHGTCDCHEGLVMSEDNRHCLPVISELLGPCSESRQCKGLGGAECFEGVCRCRFDFHYAYSKKSCILDKKYGEECTREEESCYQAEGLNNVNALGCSDKNVCKCRKHYHEVNGVCQHSGAKRAAIRLLLIAILVLFPIAML